MPESMPLVDVASIMIALNLFRRIYNFYLEACYFYFPYYRTQEVSEHRLKGKDLSGRDQQQLKILVWHDYMTIFTQFAFDILIYYTFPGYYPKQQQNYNGFAQRFLQLILNHFILSFGMYWMHRFLHVQPWCWENIHGLHHWAKHPLSRNTYEDHWLDNLANAIVGHFVAQLIMPLDYEMFIFSRVLRIMESLEKHSGISCWMNLAHFCQQWIPFAQMPHHVSCF